MQLVYFKSEADDPSKGTPFPIKETQSPALHYSGKHKTITANLGGGFFVVLSEEDLNKLTDLYKSYKENGGSKFVDQGHNGFKDKTALSV